MLSILVEVRFESCCLLFHEVYMCLFDMLSDRVLSELRMTLSVSHIHWQVFPKSLQVKPNKFLSMVTVVTKPA